MNLTKVLAMKPISKTKWKIAALGAACFILSACGGGDDIDGGDSTPVAPAPTLSLDNTFLESTISENQSFEYKVTANHQDGQITATHNYNGTGAVEMSVNGKTLSVKFSYPELHQDTEEKFNITVSDSKTSKDVSVTVHGKNISITRKFEYIDFYTGAVTSKSLFGQINRVHEFYNNGALITGKLSKTQSDQNLSSMKSIIDNAYGSISKADKYSKAEIDSIKADYAKKAIDESDIDVLVEAINLLAKSTAGPLTQEVSTLSELSDKLPPVSAGDLTMTLSGPSFFTGNLLMGTYVDEKWVFNDEYTILGDILSTTCAAE